LGAGQELEAVAITDVGRSTVWFKVRERRGNEGYVEGEYLCSLSNWHRGMNYECELSEEE
jgi:hypothetical protein